MENCELKTNCMGFASDSPQKFVAVMVFAISIRIATVGVGLASLEEDPDAYARLAVNWARSGVYGFEIHDSEFRPAERGRVDIDGQADRRAAESERVRPTAYRPPIYPWLLSFLVKDGRLQLAAVAILHIALGVLSVAITYSIALRLGVCAWLPAMAVACDPLLLRASQLVMTETLAAFQVLLIWRLWIAIDWIRPRAKATKEPVDAHGAECLGTGITGTGITGPGITGPGITGPGITGPGITGPGITGNETRVSNRLPNKPSIVAFVLGLALGLAILARPPAAPWAVLCVASLVCAPVLLRSPGMLRVLDWPDRARLAALISLGILLCVGPWMYRNYALLGRPIWATTHGGYTLLLANNPLLFKHFRESGPSRGWDAEPFHRAWASRGTDAIEPTTEAFWLEERLRQPVEPSDEVQDDQIAYESAKATIRREPNMFLLAILYRIGWFWALWPYAPTWSNASIAIGLWYLFWIGLALVGVCGSLSRKFRKRDGSFFNWIPAMMLVLSLTAVHAVYWSNMRMRGPLMSVVYLTAAAAIQKSKEIEAPPGK